MPQVSLNTPAPNFTLPDFLGETVSLSDYTGKLNILLVFNRTFS
jgi:peroxiredoxin